MLAALIVTLREGVEAALIIGIIVSYLAKIGRTDLHKTVYAALATALLGSVAGAIVFSRLKLNSDAFDGWIMLAAAFCVASMLIVMVKTSRKLKGQIESKLTGFVGARSKFGLFAFVLLLVMREGIETVLILSGVNLNTTELMSSLGTLFGVGLAVVFGVMFVKGSVRIDLKKFFKITGVILSFVVVQLVISGLHELSESGVLRSSKREMAFIGPIVRNESFFFVTMLALAGMLILLEIARKKPELQTVASQAQERKMLWTRRKERMWALMVCSTSFLFITMITAEFVSTKSAEALSPATGITLVNGRATIPKTEVTDGELHRYSANIKGTEVRFFLYKKPDGVIETVLDACSICGSSGFSKSGKGISCRHCAAPVNPESVGQPGGCNPIPLKAVVEGDKIVISSSDLEAAVPDFTRE
jgi:FTR1 family protein